MARKTRITPFGRLVIVLLIAAPLAYMAASYYNGEDGIENLKELIGLGADEETAPEAESTIEAEVEKEPAPAASTTSDSADQELGYSELQTMYSELKEENLQLKQSLKEKELKIQELQREIRLQQDTASQ